MKDQGRNKAPGPSLEVGDRLPFGELALLLGYISREELRTALRDQVLKNQKIGTILIQSGVLNKEQARDIIRMQKRSGPIEGYHLKQRIGSGGMGTVYRATQESLNRQVAVKILNLDAASNKIQRRRFIQEAHLLAQLQHPNLVQCYDIGQTEDLIYLVMEFVQGRNAREVLMHEGVFEEERAIATLEQGFEAMIHYHEKAIIHRDLKPENVLITEKGEVKITDLGLSKQLDNDLYLTRVGKTVGTPYYISPELARGQSEIDIRSDIYSLGASVYHLACGVPPFDGPSSAEILSKHVREAAPPPRKHNPKLSRAFEQFLMQLLEKEPEHRFEDPRAALEALKKVKEPPSSGRSSGKVSDNSTSGIRRRRSSASHSSHRSGRSSAQGRSTSLGRSTASVRAAKNKSNSKAGMKRASARLTTVSRRRKSSRRPLIFALLGGVAVAIGALVYVLPGGSGPRGAPGEDPALVAERAKVLALISTPEEALREAREWCQRSRRPELNVALWTAVVERADELGEARASEARLQLDQAKRALEAEAAARFDELQSRVYELSDEGRDSEALTLARGFPEKYRGTLAWTSWKNLIDELEP